jgi:DNA repair protein RadC
MIKSEDLKSLQQGHRARLRKKFLDGQLSEYEILELLLTYAIPRRDVRALSRQLFKKYGSIHHLLSMPMEDLIQNEGIKENTVAFLKLIYEVTKMEYKIGLGEKPIFHNYEKLINYCKMLLREKQKEEFHIFYLDVDHKLIFDELHSSGTVNWSAVYVREIVKKALDLNARNIYLIHNHPSQVGTFSVQDIEITKELEVALQGLNINLCDHLLVAGDTVHSARNMLLLK